MHLLCFLVLFSLSLSLFFFFFLPLEKLNNRFHFSIVFLRLTKPSRCFSSFTIHAIHIQLSKTSSQHDLRWPKSDNVIRAPRFISSDMMLYQEAKTNNLSLWTFTTVYTTMSEFNNAHLSALGLEISIGLKKKTSKHQITTDTIILHNRKSKRTKRFIHGWKRKAIAE